MAKKTRRKTAKPLKSAGEPPKVRQAVQELRDYYQLGLDVLEADRENPDRRTYSKHVSLEFAERLDVKRDYIDKARQFASSYSEEQLEVLCQLRTPDGMPLGTSLIIPLLKIKDKRERARIQRQAAKEGWSKRRLEREVRKIPGQRQSSGGRRPAKATSVEQALVQIIQRTEQWSRWFRGFESEIAGDLSLKDLPKTVRDRMAVVSEEVKELGQAAERQLEARLKQERGAKN